MGEAGFMLQDGSEEIDAIRRKLESLSFYRGPRTRDLKALERALKDFQKKNGLPENGTCDEATWKKLDEEAGSLFSEVFQYELDALRDIRTADLKVRPAAESDVFDRAHRLKLAGLAFSGGGIRSATFNLGILQALAENKLLRDFDYLSTVSGGGYIGSWFSKWIKECGGDVRKVEDALTPGSRQAPVKDEPDEIKFLRQYSNYLTPKTGLFTADTWALIATYFRNTWLNLSILVALLAAVLTLPRLLTWMVVNGHDSYRGWISWVALLAFLWAVYYIALSISIRPDPAKQRWFSSQTQGAIIWRIVVPLMVAGFCGSLALWELRDAVSGIWDRFDFGGALSAAFNGNSAENQTWGAAAPGFVGSDKIRLLWVLLLPGIVYFAVWAAGWATAQYHNGLLRKHLQSWRDLGGEGLGHLLCAVGALAVGTFLLVVSLIWFKKWVPGNPLLEHWIQLICFGMPFMLSIFGITLVLLVGLVGRLYSDRSREWWSRQGGWTIIFVFVWLGLFSIALYAPPFLGWVYARAPGWVSMLIASGWAGTTLGGLAAGHSGATGKRDSNRGLEFLAHAAPYVFTIGILALVATLVHFLTIPAAARSGICMGTMLPDFYDRYFRDTENSDPLRLLKVLFSLIGVGLLLAWRVDINKFSLYMMYRARLVRAYLGASNKKRRPHPFTGFDPKDEINLDALFKPDGKTVQKPYHIINTALNLVKGKELAWQTRKAAGFVFTPAFCGYELPNMPSQSDESAASDAARGCFRPTALYGEKNISIVDEDKGTKLGMAVAVSGAAVSPSMGYHSSPPLAFLMTLFNVRLGRWCANTRSPKWQHSSPAFGLFRLISELFGLTDADSDYVYLSDGGHFENLGIYELVRRRCRLVVVIDAGADGKMNFEDLGNAIRKCSTDLHIEIDIDVGKIDLLATGFSAAHCVAGTIHYEKIDSDAPTGILLYIKPSLTGTELADVLNYRKTDTTFPHQATTDQWFDEPQFESYRSLGYRIGTTALSEAALKSIKTTEAAGEVHDVSVLCDQINRLWYPWPGESPLEAKPTD